ncbi:D-alanyl-D-alanine carboxypeptidase/D-alanyl-D-alanine endopeptidase [Haloglycomyces albus]|uniref:D-alanyl-D-alanine carboxypeptidase/D-alanyl-D-alanine endopeptidase n=1 Tax=Haloglycomyces albus TaxID=526067 RepID=UPI00046CFC5D|nr:D-alanyl-D-alanine carboxypeptidase/D-alanyl-D-alanine-endopeptidase [Haloglycomyces albus]
MADNHGADPSKASNSPQDVNRTESSENEDSLREESLFDARDSSPRYVQVLTWILSIVAIAATVTSFSLIVSAAASPDDTEVGIITWSEANLPPEPATVLSGVDDSALSPELADVLEPIISKQPGMTASFVDMTTGEPLYEKDAEKQQAPASSLKLISAGVAIDKLGAGYRIPTTVVAGGTDDSIVLVGGGDVTLSKDGDGYYSDSGSLKDLADQVLDARGGDSPETVIVDDSAFGGSTQAPGTESGDFSHYTANMGSLMIDGGRTEMALYGARQDDPVESAAEEFATMVGASKVKAGQAPQDSDQLGQVHSPTVYDMSEYLVRMSDNTLADALAMQVALQEKGEMNWENVGEVFTEYLDELGVSTDGTDFKDGSGLSQDNRISAGIFTDFLHSQTEGERNRLLFPTMAVAGVNGSLADRFDDEEDAHGQVRGKTGTLRMVSSLTGTLVTEDGRLIAYSMIVNGYGFNRSVATSVMDEATAAAAACGC